MEIIFFLIFNLETITQRSFDFELRFLIQNTRID